MNLRFVILAALLPVLCAAGVLVSVRYAAEASGLSTQSLGVPLTPTDLANDLVGNGITISNVTYTGADGAAGTFSGGSGIIGFDEGIVLTSGSVANIIGPNEFGGITTANGVGGDADLTSLSGFPTYDATVLEFDFVPVTSPVSFQYVFASDEYNEFVNSSYNDVFAFLVNGVNCATAPGGAPVSINTINGGNPFGDDPKSNPDLYRNNDPFDGGTTIDTEMDGLTTVLTCQAAVTAGHTNHMKLAIADASDYSLDSAVMLAAGSFIPGTPTPTRTSTPTRTPTRTPSPTRTATRTPTATPTATVPSDTTPTPTATATPAPTSTPSPSPTATPTATPSPTATPVALPDTGGTVTPTPTGLSATATATPTPTGISASATPAPPTPPPTAAPTPTPTAAPVPPTPVGPFSTRTPTVRAATSTPKASASPTPTRTPPRSPTPTPASGSGGGTPQPSSGPVPTQLPFSRGPGGEHRPGFAQSVLTPGSISTDSSVLATNLAAAAVTLILLVLTAELFNKTVEENEDTIKGWFKGIFGPIEAIGERIGHTWNSTAGHSVIGLIGAPIAVLTIAGLLYGITDPGFGFNTTSLVLFISIVLTVAIITYFYNGGQILVTKSFGMDAAVRMFPAGILVVLVCVIFTRIDGFQPGIIYGFIATAIFLGGTEPSKDQNGRIIFYPVMALLGLCFIAWLLVSPFRDLANDHNSWWTALPEAVAVGVFVGGLEGTLFQMIPLRYMDGHKIYSWNKAAWVLAAGLTAFMVWEILLNKERSNMNAVSEGTPLVAIIAMTICAGLSFGFYAFFRFRNEVLRRQAEA